MCTNCIATPDWPDSPCGDRTAAVSDECVVRSMGPSGIDESAKSNEPHRNPPLCLLDGAKNYGDDSGGPASLTGGDGEVDLEKDVRVWQR